jgi:hypothetical protein
VETDRATVAHFLDWVIVKDNVKFIHWSSIEVTGAKLLEVHLELLRLLRRIVNREFMIALIRAVFRVSASCRTGETVLIKLTRFSRCFSFHRDKLDLVLLFYLLTLNNHANLGAFFVLSDVTEAFEGR